MLKTTPQRYKAAIGIQAGACNPSGIVLTLLDSIREARDEGADTLAQYADPALRLIVHQLAYLFGAAEINASLVSYEILIQTCKDSANTKGIHNETRV